MKRAGFTLTEIVLAIAIIATAMVAILGLLPAGLNASRDAADSTVTTSILEDLNNRLKGQPLRTGPVPFSPIFYDRSGQLVPHDAEDPHSLTNAIYRADIEILKWRTQPENTSGLQPAKISLSWPVRTDDGSAIGPSNPKVVVTYGVTTLTGPDWEKIDTKFVPKIDL